MLEIYAVFRSRTLVACGKLWLIRGRQIANRPAKPSATIRDVNWGFGAKMSRTNSRHTRRAVSVWTAVAGAWVLAGCAAGNLGGSTISSGPGNTPGNTSAGAAGPNVQQPSVKVAMLLPLGAKGQAGAIAKGLRQAAEMALFEQNNPNFQLVFKDTQGTPEGARAAMTAAASEGAEMVLGPLYGANVTAISPIARQARIPVIALSNDRRTAGSGVYLLSFLVGQEVDRIVGFAARQDKRRYAALIPEGAYGQIVEKAFREAVARTGSQIVALERYAPGTNGMVEPAERLFSLVKTAAETGQPVDAVFLPGGAESLPTVAPFIRSANIDPTQVKFLGTGGWDYPGVGREAAFVGGWFPAPDPSGWRSFSQRFTKSFGSAPPRIATLAYDAVTIAVTLASSYPKGQRYTAANLTRSSGFVGVDGAIRFTASGTVDRGLAVLEVQKFGTEVISPAPASFGGPVSNGARRTRAAASSGGFQITGAIR